MIQNKLITFFGRALAQIPKRRLQVKAFYYYSDLFSQSRFYFSDESSKKQPKDEKSIEEILQEVEKIDLENEEASSPFETPLQKISIALMKTTNSSQALDIYENEIKTNDKVSGEELSLILYYACYFHDSLLNGKHKFIT